MSTAELASALAALTSTGGSAGVGAEAARAEGERLAAAVAESSPRAPQAWLEATGRPYGNDVAATLQPFFDAAQQGRRWRSSPTALLAGLVAAGSPHAGAYAEALARVADAAAEIGEPSISAVAAAAGAAAVYRGAVAGRGAAASRPAGPTAPPAPADLDLGRLTGTRLPPGVPSVSDILDQLRTGSAGTGPTTPGAATGDGEATAGGARPASGSGGSAVPGEAPEPARSLEELLAELDGLVGLTRVKDEIRRQTELLRIERLRTEAGLTRPTLTRHLVFVGNPGTGKTTVARLVAGIYRALGLLEKGHLVEVDRSELVAGYLGQTATKTTEVVGRALGGVLFIDEAYALAEDQYGKEAVDTLVKDMEDHRDDLVVVVAGYPLPMARFITTNPGLESRFAKTIVFDDYSDGELRQIFEDLARRADFEPLPGTLERFEHLVAEQPRGEGFGNGRWARNMLDAAVARHAWRLRHVAAPTVDQLRQLLPEDLTDVVDISSDADPVPGPVPEPVPGPVSVAPGSVPDLTNEQSTSVTTSENKSETMSERSPSRPAGSPMIEDEESA
ncbi:AAA family ATPase [Antribacter sp. KLBMP9083]|uniref:AAA family ATPase n=1 Tax=Antribacter soli TaxID=2910976 RepID=A0AA41QA87_9MICO|nr:AAA family ATPase [Antribacter soli]MCF4119734.1 AAA family ATPase [Antribacter soli]